MSERATKVVFRKFKDTGDIIAIFPQTPGDQSPYTCSSFQLIGGHCACDPSGIISITTLATEEEYKRTKFMLESYYEYTLKVAKRITYDDQCIRADKLRR